MRVSLQSAISNDSHLNAARFKLTAQRGNANQQHSEYAVEHANHPLLIDVYGHFRLLLADYQVPS